MAQLSTCPVCTKPVLLPTAVATVQVRCPLCRAQFALQEALDAAPPMLEIVQVDADQNSGFWPSMTPEESSVVSDSFTAVGVADVDSNDHSLDLRLADEDLDTPQFVEEHDTEAETRDVESASSMELADDEESDTELEGKLPIFEDSLDEPLMFATVEEEMDFPSDAISFRGEPDLIDTPFDSEDSLEVDSFSPTELPTEAFGEREEAPQISATSSAVKNRKRESSFLGSLIGIVGGGVIAIPLALFAVIWIRGPEGDVAGMAQYLPSWMLPASFDQPKVAAVTPMSNDPKQSDLDEVKDSGVAIPPIFEPDEGGVDVRPRTPARPVDPADAANNPLPFAEGGKEELSFDETDSAADLADDLASKALSSDIPLPAVPSASTATIEHEPPGDIPSQSTAAEDSEHETLKVPADDVELGSVFGESDSKTTNSDTNELPAEVGLKDSPTYSDKELSDVLAEAVSLRSSMLAAANGDGAEQRKLKQQYFRKLYRLAEIATFAADANQATGRTAEFLTELAEDKENLDGMGRIATQWLNQTPEVRGVDKGILLAGTVDDVASKDEMFLVRITMIGSKSSISVYTPTKPNLSQGETVLVLGSIVDNPKEVLKHFAGDEAPVVWHGLSVKAGK